MTQVFSILLALSIIIPLGAWLIMGKKHGKAVLGTNVVLFFGLMIVSAVTMFSGGITGSAAPAAGAISGITDKGMGYMAAALVTGLATIGAGIAVAAASSAALGALSEDPKIMGKALIFVALAEGIALYGLLVSFSILGGL